MRRPASTHVGVMRDRYEVEVEPRPSLFMDRLAYLEWCIRADRWADSQPLKVGRVSEANE